MNVLTTIYFDNDFLSYFLSLPSKGLPKKIILNFPKLLIYIYYQQHLQKYSKFLDIPSCNTVRQYSTFFPLSRVFQTAQNLCFWQLVYQTWVQKSLTLAQTDHFPSQKYLSSHHPKYCFKLYLIIQYYPYQIFIV